MEGKNIISPETSLVKKDEFYLFYEMMMQALNTDNVKEGINKSLYLLRTFLNSSHTALYKKNVNGNYIYKISDTEMNDLIQSVSCIVGKVNVLVEQKEIFILDLNLEKIENIVLLHTKIDEIDCILTIINVDKEKELEPLFWERVRDTMQIILKRAASYEKNTKAINTDLLTGLDNRNSYEARIHALNESDNDLILGIFDLFRLKYVNDNYTHDKGDVYIKAAAKILNKYWPKQKLIINGNGTETFIDTGHCVYRVGGDEFVLLTSTENLQLAEIKAGLTSDEACTINLDIVDNLPLGLNFGIVYHNHGDDIKQTFIRADKIMQEDKRQMYKKYNLDRRR